VASAASASASAAVVVPPDKLALAAQGERQAMDELSAIAVEQRTVAQATALSKGRAAEKQMALEHLRETLANGSEPDELKKLMLFAQDGDTARGAIGIAAGLLDEKGCDLLYELQTLKSTPPEMAILAGHFLSSRDVRSKASPALALVLDLKDATSCDQRKAVLEKAIQVGDKRLVRHIVPLTKKTGCGEKKNDDCHPCLREENQKIIREALTKTQVRKSPTF
jgi:hypothetical protein